MSTQITAFWAAKADVRSSPPSLASLYIDPAGMGGSTSLCLMFDSKTELDQQVAIADRVLAGVQRWRDGIVEAADRERTAEDELAAARAEIARLKGETAEESEDGDV
ncbi:hypothetical protein SUDANB145_07384 (plasmid) [Streptomyces sp. enrichment culture]|uniref:hypothetical protein n=1 Tax=Streptomyces sp. enrichment culture TaxID=1795815 RepID=UPI003F574499